MMNRRSDSRPVAAPRRRRSDFEPIAPKPATALKPPPTIYEVRAYSEFVGVGVPVVKYVLEKCGRDAKPVLVRYADELQRGGAPLVAADVRAALDVLVEPAQPPGRPKQETLSVNGEGRVTISAKAICEPHGRVRVEIRQVDGVDAILIFKARRSTDLPQ